MKKIPALIAALAAAAALSSAAPDGVAQEELVVGARSYKVAFDPHHAYLADEAQLFTAIYEGLFTYDETGLKAVPGVCESYKQGADKKTWDFTLRADARWSTGERVTARDFRDTWLLFLDPARGAEYSSLFDIVKNARAYRLGTLKDPEQVGIRALGDGRLEIQLEAPAEYLPKLLCHHAFSPIHAKLRASRDWSKPAAIPTNGPYVLVSAGKEGIRLKKSDSYWDRANVALPSIFIRFFPDDPVAATTAFNSGEVGWLTDLFDAETLAQPDAIKLNRIFSTHFYFFSCKQKPFDDPRVRRGLALLVPWAQVRSKDVYDEPTSRLINPEIGATYPKARTIDAPDEAAGKKLLADAGYPGCKGLPDIRILVSPSDDDKRVGGIMKKVWEAAGATVRLEEVPFEDYMEKSREGDYTIASSTWIGDFADPITFLQLWLSDSNLNDGKYSDPEFDRLIALSNGQSGAERMKTLSAAESVILEGAACMPLTHSLSLNFIDTEEFGGWLPNLLDIHPFKLMFYAGKRAVQGII